MNYEYSCDIFATYCRSCCNLKRCEIREALNEMRNFQLPEDRNLIWNPNKDRKMNADKYCTMPYTAAAA